MHNPPAPFRRSPVSTVTEDKKNKKRGPSQLVSSNRGSVHTGQRVWGSERRLGSGEEGGGGGEGGGTKSTEQELVKEVGESELTAQGALGVCRSAQRVKLPQVSSSAPGLFWR